MDRGEHRKQRPNAPRRHSPKIKAVSEPRTPEDAGDIVRKIHGEALGHWSAHLSLSKLAVDAGRMSPALGALYAMRSVVDGALSNECLGDMQLQPGATITPTAPGDILAARNPDDLVPIPWWVAAALVDAFCSIRDAALKEAVPPGDSDVKTWKGFTAGLSHMEFFGLQRHPASPILRAGIELALF